MAQPVRNTRNSWFIISMCLLIVTIVSAGVTIYYYQGYNTVTKQYNDVILKLKEVSYTTNILLKYSNGTKVWFNQTLVPVGWSLFNATLKVLDKRVEYSIFYGSPFITAMNGVKATGSYAWMWYVWNATSSSWTLGETAANAYILRDKDTVAWYLVDTSAYPNIPKP